MRLIYTQSFNRDLDKIAHLPVIKRRLANLLLLLQNATTLTELSDVKKLQGYDDYYRIRIGDYRLGLKTGEHHIEIIRFLHRKDIYRQFP
ncbi:type II toxin-antitoxin system RelE/ParE family toxin [Rhodoferax sp. 4810]|uniref:Type II toxin-antitoxin system RelE/ParE family toxin n=1 Tax=Thiospirillum jenense TaxID=1653858 RepID=A0A839HE37_9GAMM|nr:type II toxin-antitoxin system RelE/ParE family toxin [Thiospirillum jenense]MBB1074719.1 type II toxin-antitoxin system RelE/ParE family toxin [Rhodoferax jenense]MBB1125437.1 type II toxin-antitoxin system RelE/ParE family toxin [Thiospirillum jenense]